MLHQRITRECLYINDDGEVNIWMLVTMLLIDSILTGKFVWSQESPAKKPSAKSQPSRKGPEGINNRNKVQSVLKDCSVNSSAASCSGWDPTSPTPKCASVSSYEVLYWMRVPPLMKRKKTPSIFSIHQVARQESAGAILGGYD
jgi:hypothetical protein